MMRITEKISMEDVLQVLPEESRHYFVDPRLNHMLQEALGVLYEENFGQKGFTGQTFEDLKESVPAWNTKSMIQGVQYLVDRLEKGQVFYDIWSSQEIEEEPVRQYTGLAAFPVEHPAKYVLICPGGGYENICAMAEGYPVAKKMNELGYAAFVLQYRVDPEKPLKDRPLEDVAKALTFINQNAERFHVIPGEYAIAGFSAGGHLAGSFCVKELGYEKYSLPRPEAVFLSYPVVTLGEEAHVGSRNALLGVDSTEEERKRYSVEQHVTKEFPPVFVWQCDGDDTVPFANSRMLVEELNRHQVPNSYEVYHSTAHGWGAADGTLADNWILRAVRFWDEQ